MMRKVSAMLAAALLAVTALAPIAEARDRDRDHRRGDGYSRYYDRDHDRGRRHWRRDDDNDDAIAAGAVGLILGLALGSLASSQPSQPRTRCYDNYQRCAAPPRDDYYERDSRYYDDRGSGGAYEREYGLEGGGYYEDDAPPCIRRQRQWDSYANRYVNVDVPC